MTQKTAKKKKTRISSATDFYFDEAAADRAVQFFETYCVHIKGEWAGKPFVLEPWQKERIVRPLFGWKRKSDGTRRYRTVYIEIPRKNGKSTLAGPLAIYLLLADNEPGAEVYSAAGDREQASIVFNAAQAIVEASPALRKRIKVYKRSLYVAKTLSSYKVLSADAKTKHGFNAHGIIFDELHTQPNRDLWDVLTTSTGARRQPVVVAITTAGYDRKSICWEVHDYADKVARGVIEDDSFLSVIYGAEEKDDWTDPKIWHKANPNLGISVSEEYLARECHKAQNSPAYENTFRRLHLNQWVQQLNRWLPMAEWKKSAGEVNLRDLIGKPCWAGLDLSRSTDLTSLSLVFPEGDSVKVLPVFWIPQDRIADLQKKDRVPYDVWVRNNLVYATPGNVVDYKFILKTLEDLRGLYDIQEIAFDRWGAVQITQDLQEMGFTVVPFGQGFRDMAGPTKDFYNRVLMHTLHHGDNPVLSWMADNVIVIQDPAGNQKPDKSKSSNKIDGIVATIMALDRATRHNRGQIKSVYEERGIRTL